MTDIYYKKLLDHGHIRLVDAMGNDLSIVRNARVSYDASWRAGEDEGSDSRLLRYLLANGHSTPFESVTFTFEVKAPIFVFRQWHRHRTWAYNELSARYRELPEEFYIPNPEDVGEQATTNKQGRQASQTDRVGQIFEYTSACQNSFAQYRELLAAGWPRELARMCLPLSTYSHMFATVSLWNLMRFLGLRWDKHAQYEIRVYAEAMAEMVSYLCPVSMRHWMALHPELSPGGLSEATVSGKI